MKVTKISDFDNRIVGKIANIFPNNMTIGSENKNFIIEKVKKFSTPENRLFLGATALAFQPFIDLHNKDVDEKTRKISCYRTIAKIIAGTLTGILIRKACIKSINALTRTPRELSEFKKLPTALNGALIPSHLTREKFTEAERLVKKHRDTIGSFFALGVMLFTNFAIDVPLTKFLTNFLMEKYPDKKTDNKKGGN